MFGRLIDNRDPQSLASRLRKKRLGLFWLLVSGLPEPVTILDIGGTEIFWQISGLPLKKKLNITLLNLERIPTSLPNISSVAGDAREIQFPDLHFDVVFSNSVIEHVGNYSDQERMAGEVMRVGKRYFIQTPNKYFPIEPHFVFPLYQFLPNTIQVWLLQNFKLGWIKRTPDKEKARETIKSIRLLRKTEFEALFPQSKIWEEKFLGLTKSFIAYGGW
jgi:ubiquinone/menaquinone biosynthesis C-methylase UbiE